MSREIKFRYVYSDGTNFIMKVFTLDEIVNGYPFEVLSDNPLLKRYKHIGQDQWTGLCDRNKKEIFERDIVDWKASPMYGTSTISFYEAGFRLAQYVSEDNLLNSDFCKKSCEVVGNTWQNRIKD